jgi:translocation and assembly module TamB
MRALGPAAGGEDELQGLHAVVRARHAHRDRIDTEVDFTVETDVREYRVVVHGYGRLLAENGTDFQLQLASDPPLPRADVLTVGTFGITSRDPNAGANAAAGAGVAAEALWKVSGLDAQVRRWLPDSELFRDPTLNVTSQYSEITGQLEPTASFETKFLDERLRLKASTPFSTPKGRRASAEYRVDEHLSGQILWENEETGYSAGDLGVDLKLRWEWE